MFPVKFFKLCFMFDIFYNKILEEMQIVFTDLEREISAPLGQEEKHAIIYELVCGLNRWLNDNFVNFLRRVSK